MRLGASHDADPSVPSSLNAEGGKYTVQMRGTTFEVDAGTTLRTAMLRNGVTPHNGGSKEINCRGLRVSVAVQYVVALGGQGGGSQRLWQGKLHGVVTQRATVGDPPPLHPVFSP